MEQTILDFNIKGMLPELIIVSALVLLLSIDLIWKEHLPRKWLGAFGLGAILVAGGLVLSGWEQLPYSILADTYRLDSYGSIFKLLLLGGASFVFLFLLSQPMKKGEPVYLLLAAVLGGMVMASSADLITLFVGLELLSLSSYILVGMNKEQLAASEAAWKYVILGGVSSAFILYGISFMYGLTGSTHLFTIQSRLLQALQVGYEPFFWLAFFLMLVGFAFKIATVPFHMWAPDVYQGAPTTIASFLAVVSKTAAFAFVLRVFLIIYLPVVTLEQWESVLSPALMMMAALSMIIGNVVAIQQTNAKRLMAYSSIAQAGYMLVPLATLGFNGALLFSSLVYYLLGYLLMTIGAFVILDFVTRANHSEEIRSFAGLYQRSPWLAFAMTVFLISLAGIPITAGFFGKFYLLMSALADQQLWLVGVMIVTTVISYYYYFAIIRQMYFRTAPAAATGIRLPWTASVVVAIGLLGTIALGLFPDPILHQLGQIHWGDSLVPVMNQMEP
jgi:NADH-quinone oxidoreductase subunit N